MLRLLQWLIFGHVHSWEIHKEVPTTTNIEKPMGGYHIGKTVTTTTKFTRYVLKCKHCGEIKFVDSGVDVK